MAEFDHHDHRVTVIEKEQALLRNDLKHIDDRFDRLEQSLSKLMWLVVSAVVSGGIAILMSNGAPGG